jgi:hypothetical protein
MTDPRFNDPRYIDPRYSDPVLCRDETNGGAGGSIAGIAIIAVIAFGIIVGWNGNKNSTSNNLPQMATGSVDHAMPPSVAGSGPMLPRPLMQLPRHGTP